MTTWHWSLRSCHCGVVTAWLSSVRLEQVAAGGRDDCMARYPPRHFTRSIYVVCPSLTCLQGSPPTLCVKKWNFLIFLTLLEKNSLISLAQNFCISLNRFLFPVNDFFPSPFLALHEYAVISSHSCCIFVCLICLKYKIFLLIIEC